MNFLTSGLFKGRKGWLLRRQLYLNHQLTIDPVKILMSYERVRERLRVWPESFTLTGLERLAI